MLACVCALISISYARCHTRGAGRDVITTPSPMHFCVPFRFSSFRLLWNLFSLAADFTNLVFTNTLYMYVYSPPNLCVVDICENTYLCCSSFLDTIIVYYLFFSPPATCSSAALAVFTYLFLNVHYSQFITSLHAMLISNPILDPHLEDVCARATLLCSVHDDDLISTVALRLFYIYRQRKPTPFLTLYL